LTLPTPDGVPVKIISPIFNVKNLEISEINSSIPHNISEVLPFRLTKNGNIVQKGNTSEMLWGIDELISEISKFFTLKIGDIIFTGTPSGVGRVNENDNLVGYINDKECFSIKIK
jgi:2-keto-4-pentenoate hydratase/2-oxohepta-3-ene-1,7-dioic acid hydratase in catechol pathway